MNERVALHPAVLALLLLAAVTGATGAMGSTVAQQPPGPLTYYSSSMIFAVGWGGWGGSIACNGTYLGESTVIVKSVEPINETMAWVHVEIKSDGVYYWPDICTHRDSINVTEVCCEHRIKTVARDYRLELKYLVDTTTNYAWIDGEFIGFFPLYIFPKLGYHNVTKNTYYYLGYELNVAKTSEGGKVAPFRFEDLGLTTLLLKNKYIEIYFVYHYPVYIAGYLPIGNHTYLYGFPLSIDNSWIPYLKSIDDYPKSVTIIDYGRLALTVLVASSIAVTASVWWRRRTGGPH